MIAASVGQKGERCTTQKDIVHQVGFLNAVEIVEDQVGDTNGDTEQRKISYQHGALKGIP